MTLAPHSRSRASAWQRLALCLTSLGLLAALPSVASAEINIEESVEWLAYTADRVVVGRIVAIQPPPAQASRKSRGLTLYTVEVTNALPGSKIGHRLCVGIRQPGLKDDRLLMRNKARLLFFLYGTLQATSMLGLPCNLWPLRASSSLPWVVRLDQPQKRLLSAASFKVLRRRSEILKVVGGVLKKRGKRSLAILRKPLPKHYLEAPFRSEVFKVLYSGSACYLIVPKALFPRAKPRLGR